MAGPSGRWNRVMADTMAMPAVPAMAATDRSNWPTTSGTIAAMARTTIGVCEPTRTCRFWVSAKPLAVTLNTIIMIDEEDEQRPPFGDTAPRAAREPALPEPSAAEPALARLGSARWRSPGLPGRRSRSSDYLPICVLAGRRRARRRAGSCSIWLAIASSVISGPASCATMRPATRTSTRSHRSTSSSRSELTTTAQPALGDRALDQRVDVGPGAHVDALRRLVDQQHGRLGPDSARPIRTFCWLPPDSELRLASAERARTPSCSIRCSRGPPLGPPVEESAPVAPDVRRGRVRRHRHVREPDQPALLGQEPHPGRAGGPDAAAAELDAVDDDRAAAGQLAVEGAQDRAATRSGNAGQADDLTASHLEIDAVRRAGRQPADLQQDRRVGADGGGGRRAPPGGRRSARPGPPRSGRRAASCPGGRRRAGP